MSLRILLSTTLVTLLPGIAYACPSCAAARSGGLGQTIAIGSMIVLPFVIAGVVLALIPRDFGSAEEES